MTEILLTSTGQMVPATDAEQLVAAYREIQDLEQQAAADRHAIAAAFREHHALPALTNTVRLPGVKVEVQGGPREDLDGRGLRASLLTLAADEDSPITPEQVEAAFTARSYYSPNRKRWDKFLELGGERVAALVEMATSQKDSPFRLSISGESDDDA